MKRLFFYLAATLLVVGCNPPIEDKISHIVDFENIDNAFLAGPTAYGDNLYEGADNQFISYTDPATSLVFGINEAFDAHNFYNGGFAISQWNNMSENLYTNQCSVYYKDPKTQMGGYNGSKTFAIFHTSATAPTEIYFSQSGKEVQFAYCYVANSTYTYLSAKNGSDYNAALNYSNKGWLKLTITGYDTAGNVTNSVEHYLADFRNEKSSGLSEGWERVDLSTLGFVAKLSFDITGSDVGEWGLNTPAYCCIDEIAIF